MKRAFHALQYVRALRGVILFFLGAVTPALHGQEILPALKNQAVVLDITTRVAQQQTVTRNTSDSRITLSGKPVSVKLEGVNTLIYVQFTPFLNEKGEHLLVTQSQIWVNVPGEGMHYQTSMQSMRLNFGEKIVFLPLGNVDTPRIELEIVLRHYEDKDAQTAIPSRGSAPLPEKP
ncbi:hypothetical protein FACS1894161_4230 [Spirochaetia bacterium]|nr:hypothetical protein FACS1894161_4230 [Spirochaetia bacterium]